MQLVWRKWGKSSTASSGPHTIFLLLMLCALARFDFRWSQGALLSLWGFDQKIFSLLDRILGRLVTDPRLYIRPALFASIKEKLLRGFKNDLFEPMTHAHENLLNLTLNRTFPFQCRVEALQSVTFEDVCEFWSEFLCDNMIRGLFVGNVDSKQVVEYSTRLTQL